MYSHNEKIHTPEDKPSIPAWNYRDESQTIWSIKTEKTTYVINHDTGYPWWGPETRKYEGLVRC